MGEVDDGEVVKKMGALKLNVVYADDFSVPTMVEAGEKAMQVSKRRKQDEDEEEKDEALVGMEEGMLYILD